MSTLGLCPVHSPLLGAALLLSFPALTVRIHLLVLLFLLAPPKTPETERHKTMEICVKSFDGEKYTVEVGVDDTTADIRRKVASAAELREDGFDMSFGEKLLAEGDDTTQLSAGDTVVLTNNSQKYNAIAALRDLGETALTSERFKGLADPNLVHLFLQAEVVTELPNAFLAGSPFSELDLSGVPGVTAIGFSFLYDCTSLHTADLSGWSNVTQIGSQCFYRCTSLTALDLSGWNSVRQVGQCFISHCRSLTTLALPGWRNVSQIEFSFLSNCSALHTLDLSGWSSVTQIGDRFLYNCNSLTTLDVSGWSNVTHVGSDFLSCCRALTELDLSTWKDVTQVGNSFVSGCKSLKRLNLSGWKNVTHIPDDFVTYCKKLRTLDLSGWASVTHVGRGVLYDANLQCSINVTGSSSVVSKYVHSIKPKCVCM